MGLPTIAAATTAIVAIAAAATSVSTATATAGGLVFSQLYSQLTTFKCSSVKCFYSFLGFFVVCKFNKSESPAFPGFPVEDNFSRAHSTIGFKHFLQLLIVDIVGQSGNK